MRRQPQAPRPGAAATCSLIADRSPEAAQGPPSSLAPPAAFAGRQQQQPCRRASCWRSWGRRRYALGRCALEPALDAERRQAAAAGCNARTARPSLLVFADLCAGCWLLAQAGHQRQERGAAAQGDAGRGRGVGVRAGSRAGEAAQAQGPQARPREAAAVRDGTHGRAVSAHSELHGSRSCSRTGQ